MVLWVVVFFLKLSDSMWSFVKLLQLFYFVMTLCITSTNSKPIMPLEKVSQTVNDLYKTKPLINLEITTKSTLSNTKKQYIEGKHRLPVTKSLKTFKPKTTNGLKLGQSHITKQITKQNTNSKSGKVENLNHTSKAKPIQNIQAVKTEQASRGSISKLKQKIFKSTKRPPTSKIHPKHLSPVGLKLKRESSIYVTTQSPTTIFNGFKQLVPTTLIPFGKFGRNFGGQAFQFSIMTSTQKQNEGISQLGTPQPYYVSYQTTSNPSLPQNMQHISEPSKNIHGLLETTTFELSSINFKSNNSNPNVNKINSPEKLTIYTTTFQFKDKLKERLKRLREIQKLQQQERQNSTGLMKNDYFTLQKYQGKLLGLRNNSEKQPNTFEKSEINQITQFGNTNIAEKITLSEPSLNQNITNSNIDIDRKQYLNARMIPMQTAFQTKDPSIPEYQASDARLYTPTESDMWDLDKYKKLLTHYVSEFSKPSINWNLNFLTTTESWSSPNSFLSAPENKPADYVFNNRSINPYLSSQSVANANRQESLDDIKNRNTSSGEMHNFQYQIEFSMRLAAARKKLKYLKQQLETY